MDASALYNRVCDLLKKHPDFRDNDKALVVHLWGEEIDGNTPAHSFLMMYAMDLLPSADSITRLRRKAQEEKPELRGKLYLKRHAQEAEVINDLNQL